MTAHQSPGQVRNLKKKPCRDPLNGHQSTCIWFFICKLIFQHLKCHSVHYHGNFTKEFLPSMQWPRCLLTVIVWWLYHSTSAALQQMLQEQIKNIMGRGQVDLLNHVAIWLHSPHRPCIQLYLHYCWIWRVNNAISNCAPTVSEDMFFGWLSSVAAIA